MARWRARSIITYRAIRTFEPEFKDEDCSDLNAIDRAPKGASASHTKGK
jgi:hypothetical protein